MWDAMVLEQWDSGKPLLNVRTHNPSLSVRVAKVTSWVTHSLQSFHKFFMGLAFWHSRGLLLFRYLVHRFQMCHNEIFFAWSGLSNAWGWSNCVPRVVWSGISSTHLVRFLSLQSATLILRFFHCILFFEHWLCELEVKFGANDNEDLFYKICFYQITHFIWPAIVVLMRLYYSELTVEKSLRQWQTKIACLGCLFLSLCVPDSGRKFSLVIGCTELILSELETLLLSLSVLDVSL